MDIKCKLSFKTNIMFTNHSLVILLIISNKNIVIQYQASGDLLCPHNIKPPISCFLITLNYPIRTKLNTI